MFRRIASYVRERWHPLWRLRQSAFFRSMQRRFDFTVDVRIAQTGLRVAVKVLRDASWIANSGNTEPGVRRAFALVLEHLKPATFWDIGANIGFYSWFVRLHPSVREVVMFEPNPTNFKLLSRTISRNAITNCKAMNVALSDQNGEAAFLVDRASGAGGSLEAVSCLENTHSLHSAYRMGETIHCRTVTVDSLIAEGIPSPDFIKIDVEGAEHLVLGGADSCLSQRHPAMIIETVNADIIRRLKDAGYRVFRIDETNFLFVHRGCKVDMVPIESAFPAATTGN